MSNRQQFVYYDRLTETIINPKYTTPRRQQSKGTKRTHLTIRYNKVVYEGKHLLPGTYFKRFIANGGAPWGTSLLTHYERREILFTSFASIPLRSMPTSASSRSFRKKIDSLNKSSRQIVEQKPMTINRRFSSMLHFLSTSTNLRNVSCTAEAIEDLDIITA